MRIEIAGQTGGGVQFVVYAENDADRVVLAVFEKQTREDFAQPWIHGFTNRCDDKMIGPQSFNFGTRKVGQ